MANSTTDQQIEQELTNEKDEKNSTRGSASTSSLSLAESEARLVDPDEVKNETTTVKKIKKPMTEKQKEVRMANLQKALLKRKENKEVRISEKEISKLEREVAKQEKFKKLDEKKENLKKELTPQIDEVEVKTKKKKASLSSSKEKIIIQEDSLSDSSSSSEEEVIIKRKKPHKKTIPVYDEDDYVNLIQKTAQEKLKEKLNSERVKMAMMSLFN